MVEIDLKDVEKELGSQGFAVREGNLHGLSYSALRQRNWKPAPQKSGAIVTTLRPMEKEQAPARTLSAIHGLDAQPLHTDGAHLRRMLDVFVVRMIDPRFRYDSILLFNSPADTSP